MKNLALSRIKRAAPYRPPLDGRSAFSGLLLDLNERTTVSKAAVAAVMDYLAAGTTQLYPEYGELEVQIAEYVGVAPPQVMVTNGVDQAIDVLFRTFTDVGDEVVIPEPSFALYEKAAAVTGNRVTRPRFSADLEFPLDEVVALAGHNLRLIVINNPHNPTGALIPIEVVEKIACAAPGTVIYVDETYSCVTLSRMSRPFSGSTAWRLLRRPLISCYSIHSPRLPHLRRYVRPA